MSQIYENIRKRIEYMILCAGEILVDMIETETNGKCFCERKAGGAPFNVACAAKRFGAAVAFVGCVGNDPDGRFLSDFAARRQFDATEIAVDPVRRTTRAFVHLDSRGERSFRFSRRDTADFHMPPVSGKLLDAATVVHLGSLMLSEPEGASYALKLAKRANAGGIPLAFDVNYRSDVFDDVSVLREMMRLADLIKFSEDEIKIFGESYIDNELNKKTVFVTRGERGAEWRFRGKRHKIPTIKVSPVDTTGAGDAFWAGTLSRLDGIPIEKYTDETLDAAVRFGNVAGALNTLGRGATDALPSKEEIESVLSSAGFS